MQLVLGVGHFRQLAWTLVVLAKVGHLPWTCSWRMRGLIFREAWTVHARESAHCLLSRKNVH